MPDAYEIFDGRYVQFTAVESAADALIVVKAPVPLNKVHTVLQASGTPSADENVSYWFSIFNNAFAHVFPVTLPATYTFDVSTANWMPMLTNGMELKLFPGEQIGFCRSAVGAAGSTLRLYVRFLESDLPFYEYTDPQERKRVLRTAAEVRRSVGGFGGGHYPSTPPPAGGRGTPFVK